MIQQVDDHTYLVDASMKLSDINDAIGTSFDSEDFDSIGGIIIGLLTASLLRVKQLLQKMALSDSYRSYPESY